MVSKNQCKLLTETVVPNCWMRESSWSWLLLNISFNDFKLQFGGTWACFMLGSVPAPCARRMLAQGGSSSQGRHRNTVTWILSAAVSVAAGYYWARILDYSKENDGASWEGVWALWEQHETPYSYGKISNLKLIQCITTKSIITSLPDLTVRAVIRS